MSHAGQSTKQGSETVCDQQRVIDFLRTPSNYDPEPADVIQIDTHAAIIFLAGEYAYKIKRAIQLPYLDFRSLEERHRVCLRELEINQPNAPRIYLDVMPVTGLANGGLSLGGAGQPVEWVLRMRRFSQQEILDDLANRGALELDVITQLAEILVQFHARAPVDLDQDAEVGLRDVIETTTDAFRRRKPFLGTSDVDTYRDAISTEFRARQGDLKQRASEGCIRRCHGDLHLRNIVLLDGRPTLFDAIEFDEKIATVDILYDLAFLIMDLWHRGLKRHANALLNRYIYRSPDGHVLDGLRLLPLFLSLRGAVRSMVALDALPHIKEIEQPAKQDEAVEYFHRARSFLEPNKPHLLAVGGLSGTGKSTLAAALAPGIGTAPGAYIVRSDVERKLLFDTLPETQLGGEAYTEVTTARVYDQVYRKAERALSAGHAVIADAVFSKPCQREAIANIARELDVPFVGLWLEAQNNILLTRVAQRVDDASDANVQVVKKQLSYDVGPINWITIDASGSQDAVAARVRQMLPEAFSS